MACTNFPRVGLVPNVTTHTVGDVIYKWTGVVWEAVTGSLDSNQINWVGGKTVKNSLDDNEGFKQALLDEAGIVNSGLPDTAEESQRLVALNKLFNENLAAVDTDRVIAGVDATYLNLLTKKNGVDDYTIINPDVSKISASIMSTTQSLKCVITGDSLSFNAFGYNDEFSVNGSGYATDQPFGMSSWSHLLRDLWFTSNAGFTGVQNLNVIGTAARSFPLDVAGCKNLGINAKAAFYNFADTSKSLTISTNYSGASHLVVSYAPEADAILFDVNGVEFDNTSPNGNYQGYGYMLVPIGVADSVIDNVRKKSGGAGGFWLYGISASNAKIPEVTGKGAWTSGQILAEYSSLVAPYSPDVIYYIIGANDINNAVPLEVFRSNLQTFIDNSRTVKPDCVIVLLSSVPSSTTSLNRETTKTYIKVMYEVAVLNNCSLIDMYSKLEQIDPSYWRFDNIHFNARGNDIVFHIIKQLTIPQVPVRPDVFYPSRATYLGVRGAFMKSRFLDSSFLKPQTVVIQFAATNPIILASASSNDEFASSLVLSYLVDAGSDKARVVCPSTHAIGTISEIVIGSDFTERVVCRYIENKRSMDYARVNSAGRQTIAGSNLYAVITFVPV